MLRPDYRDSLGNANQQKADEISRKHTGIPEIVRVIYSQVQGTRHGVQDQKLMDFIPGYRLIHIDEYNDCWERSRKIVKNFGYKGTFFPILANYSSDFIGVCNEKGESSEGIYSVEHDDDQVTLMYKDQQSFLATICEFYKQDVYFVDDDGFLDYDPEKEGEVGSAANPGVDYWLQ